jgi:translation initiation factor IF-3
MKEGLGYFVSQRMVIPSFQAKVYYFFSRFYYKYYIRAYQKYKPTMITTEQIQNLKAQIAQGDIDNVLQQLNQVLEGSSHHNDIIMISGRLAYLQKQVRMGIISQSQANLTNNQINASLIDLLDQLENKSNTINQTTDK